MVRLMIVDIRYDVQQVPGGIHGLCGPLYHRDVCTAFRSDYCGIQPVKSLQTTPRLSYTNFIWYETRRDLFLTAKASRACVRGDPIPYRAHYITKIG